ncbi:MAG: DNA topoisomerase [Clostridia bacterium]|nr:DNA topoisomerase [Clostridia bacterium]
MAKKSSYGNDSISQLKGEDRVRKRPQVIFGSNGIEGCEHSIFEILSNSIDEAREGYGTKIIVTKYRDNSVEIQDFGRGIPVDFNNNEQRFNWELVFCELYAGGKIDSENYEFSLGLNGLGLCATQYASEYMDAEIKTGGFIYNLHFEKGRNIGGLQKAEYGKKDTGTRIRWRPDLEVFTDIDVSDERYHEMIKRQAVVNKGVRFIFNSEREKGFETTEYYYEDGIVDYLRERVGEGAISDIQHWVSGDRFGRDRDDLPEYKVKMEIAVAFSNKVKFKEYFHNSSWLEHGGAPEKAVKSAFISQIDAYLKQNNKYTKSDAKISYQDIEDCLAIVISSLSTQSSYENQTKKSINNKFIQETMTEFLRQQLEVYFLENKVEAEKIAEQILLNMRSRIKAETVRQNIKKTGNVGGKDMLNRVQKFVDCRSKDVSERELFIVEGDSALGACKQARNPDFQAIIPVRGKILNCLKADYGKIFKNEIITDLIKVLGCGVEVKAKASKELSSFDLSLLRWNKIIICTDADVDGFQIRTLILTMLYRLTPTLIEEGKVFIAESPLYEITTKTDTYFAYTEREKAEILKKIGDAKYTIQRSKGLGENEADMMSLTTMNPATRRLIKVEPTDAQRTAEMFDLLLGDNLAGRKEHIARYGHMYTDLADIS